MSSGETPQSEPPKKTEPLSEDKPINENTSDTKVDSEL